MSSSDNGEVETRKVSVPRHRFKPLKKQWMEIYTLVHNVMNINIRMNIKTRNVELKTLRNDPNIDHLQKCVDFVHVFVLGFDVEDARLMLFQDNEEEEAYINSFEIKDVVLTPLSYEAMAKLLDDNKSAIENVTATKIVIQDGHKIHILGARESIKVARDAIVSKLVSGFVQPSLVSRL